jgi:hypothetical protein
MEDISMIKTDGLHKLETLLLSNLSDKGSGLSISLFLFTHRRDGVKESEMRGLIHILELAGIVEKVGQFLWLTKKGATNAKTNKFASYI